MITELNHKILPIRQKTFTVTSALSFHEYLATLSVEQRQLMQTRLSEVRLPVDSQEFLLAYPDTLNLLVLVSDETPETLIVLPILERMVAAAPRLVLRVVRDTDDLSLLETAVEELELDEESELDLPILFIFDEEWCWQTQWGPQPEAAEAYLEEWLEANPTYERLAESDNLEDQDTYWQLTDQLLYEMRMWYNSTLDQACIREVCTLLQTLVTEDEADDDRR
jgi:hypothetical protein